MFASPTPYGAAITLPPDFGAESQGIVLDTSQAGESHQPVAAVLGHEADHARVTFQYGPPRTEAACYSFTITVFALEQSGGHRR